MDKEKLDTIQSKLFEMNKIIAKLDPAIRGAAFEIMAPYYFEDKPIKKTKEFDKSKGGEGKGSTQEIGTTDLASFIGRFEHQKPKDNVRLLVAWLYSQYGAYPIPTKEIEELANDCGLVIPTRCDNTMRYAKHKGKSLFYQQGKGWKLTVGGELHLKSKYNVQKGNKPFQRNSK